MVWPRIWEAGKGCRPVRWDDSAMVSMPSIGQLEGIVRDMWRTKGQEDGRQAVGSRRQEEAWEAVEAATAKYLSMRMMRRTRDR
jgi:hypothetical protein